MIEFSPFRLDCENQCLWRGVERVSFTPKAFVMLEYLDRENLANSVAGSKGGDGPLSRLFVMVFLRSKELA
jgi:hypothetical protein